MITSPDNAASMFRLEKDYLMWFEDDTSVATPDIVRLYTTARRIAQEKDEIDAHKARHKENM